jgi:hypothetical protein
MAKKNTDKYQMDIDIASLQQMGAGVMFFLNGVL